MRDAASNSSERAHFEALTRMLADAGQGAAVGDDALYRSLVEGSPDLCLLLDRDGIIRFVNSAAMRLLGHEPDTLLGQPCAVLVDAEDLEAARQLFDGQRPGPPVRHARLRLKRHSRRAGPRPEQSTRLWAVVTLTRLYREQAFVGAIVLARDILGLGEISGAAHFAAYHDVLTRLPNRAILEDRLGLAIAQAERDKRRLTVAFLDLDRFKLVNDKHGHAIGDRVLQAVARRLRGCLRRGDTLSRFGGDEFALVLPEVESGDAAVAIGEKLVGALREPLAVDDTRLSTTASAGVALYPEAGTTARALIGNADIAMYHAKGEGGDACRLFGAEMHQRFSARLGMERALRQALDSGEIEVHYQPQVDLASRAIVGMEALARWRRGDGGLVEASEFLPLAEETGLIGRIDALVQQAAFTQVAAWRTAGHGACRVAVNASAWQLDQANFVRDFEASLAKAGLPAAAATLEITENALMRDPALVVPKLQHLRHRGVRIAIDEFGAGYSSLAQLRHMPIDALKIDRSFVADLAGGIVDTRAVDAVAGACRGLGLALCAEGIEHQAQIDYLLGVGCREGQGYFFSGPLVAEEAMAPLPGDKRG